MEDLFLVFWFCEKKSLKDANLSDMKYLVTEKVEVSKYFEQFKTIFYLSVYFLVLLVFDLDIANLIYLPRDFGLLKVLAYTFKPSILGS